MKKLYKLYYECVSLSIQNLWKNDTEIFNLLKHEITHFHRLHGFIAAQSEECVALGDLEKNSHDPTKMECI